MRGERVLGMVLVWAVEVRAHDGVRLEVAHGGMVCALVRSVNRQMNDGSVAWMDGDLQVHIQRVLRCSANPHAGDGRGHARLGTRVVDALHAPQARFARRRDGDDEADRPRERGVACLNAASERAAAVREGAPECIGGGRRGRFDGSASRYAIGAGHDLGLPKKGLTQVRAEPRACGRLNTRSGDRRPHLHRRMPRSPLIAP